MLRKVLISERQYIDTSDPAIDIDRWDPDLISRYFEDNFALPPLKRDADGPPTYEEIEDEDARAKAIARWQEHANAEPTVWRLGQLTGKQMYELKVLQAQHNKPVPDGADIADKPIPPEVIRFVIQYGLKGWSGIYTEDEHGGVHEFTHVLVDSPLGKRLSDECYYDLLGFFALGSERMLLGLILFLSRP